MRNIRTKVSKAYEGKLSDMVQEIIADKEGLDSRKTLYFEETGNQDKIVIPNITPFKAIGMIAKRALPKYSKGAGMYFYETTRGFLSSILGEYAVLNMVVTQETQYKSFSICHKTLLIHR